MLKEIDIVHIDGKTQAVKADLVKGKIVGLGHFLSKVPVS